MPISVPKPSSTPSGRHPSSWGSIAFLGNPQPPFQAEPFSPWQVVWARTSHLPGTGLHACLGWSRCGRRCPCSLGSRGRPRCPGPHRCTGGGQEGRVGHGEGNFHTHPNTPFHHGLVLSSCSPWKTSHWKRPFKSLKCQRTSPLKGTWPWRLRG